MSLVAAAISAYADAAVVVVAVAVAAAITVVLLQPFGPHTNCLLLLTLPLMML